MEQVCASQTERALSRIPNDDASNSYVFLHILLTSSYSILPKLHSELSSHWIDTPLSEINALRQRLIWLRAMSARGCVILELRRTVCRRRMGMRLLSLLRMTEEICGRYTLIRR